jgi:hypothetical protein
MDQPTTTPRKPPLLCVHGTRKGRCKEGCGGQQLCVHSRIKYTCKECKGPGLCVHGNVPSDCKECGGSRYCEHGKYKRACILCGGSVLCVHGVKQYSCKPCGGKGYCEHNRIKGVCKECGGSQVCPHNKVKYHCRECGGGAYCEHEKLKIHCRPCGGSGLCEHDKLKNICKQCGGKNICKHNKHKNYCKECGGAACCKSSWCSTIPSNKVYQGYCLVCYIHLFPDQPIVRNYKTKERAVADFVKTTFSDQTWIQDKCIADGCSAKRPDLLCDLGDQVLLIEIDEDQHTAYDCSCENKRLMELSQDIDHRPMVLIRFNPDGYDEVPSCWKVNKFGTCSLTDESEWASRLQTLKTQIAYWLANRTSKTVECIQLYFSAPTKEQ